MPIFTVRCAVMKRNTVTIASFTVNYGWARFMGAGFFAMEKKNER